MKLKRSIADRLDANSDLPYGPDCPEARTFRALMEELCANVPNVKRAITLELKRRLAVDIRPSDFVLQIHQIGESEVKAETNISEVFRINDHEAHDIINRGLMRLAGISRKLAEMERHTALCGLNDQDFPLFARKFEFLTQEFRPNSQIDQLSRVMEIKD